MANTIIRFEDHGQDFLTWEVNEIGVVVDSKPFQAALWRGCVVKQVDNIKPGDQVIYGEKDFDVERKIRIPVLEITKKI